MKKLLFCVIVLLLLAGCGAPAPTAVPAPTAETGVYYWLAINISHPFYIPGIAGWNAAAKELGVNAKFVGPQESILAEQIKTFEELIANPTTKGIFLYPMDANAGEPLVKEAEAKGITVVMGNSDSTFKTRSGFIGTDNVIMGQQAAAFAAKIINCKGSVGAIANNVGAASLDRAESFNAEIARLCPAVVVEDTGIFDANTGAGLALLDSYMIAHPNLTFLWWTEGSASLMVQPWKEKQDAGLKTLFLGTDMPDAGLEAVRDGIFIGTLGQDTFTEEYFGLLMLVTKQKGLNIPDTTLLGTIIVTKDNVGQYLK